MLVISYLPRRNSLRLNRALEIPRLREFLCQRVTGGGPCALGREQKTGSSDRKGVSAPLRYHLLQLRRIPLNKIQ